MLYMNGATSRVPTVTAQHNLCSAELNTHPFLPCLHRSFLLTLIRPLHPKIPPMDVQNLTMTGRSCLFQFYLLANQFIFKIPSHLHWTNKASLFPCVRTVSPTSLTWITGFSPAHDVFFVLSIQTHPLPSHRLLPFRPHLYYDVHFILNLVLTLLCYRPLHTPLLCCLIFLQNGSPHHQLWTEPRRQNPQPKAC